MKSLFIRRCTLAFAISGSLAMSPVWAGGNHGHGSMEADMKVSNPIEAEETGFGRQGQSREVSRTIDINMSDMMRFSPELLAIKQGETIRFRIKNEGEIPHEFVLGLRSEIAEHAELMKKNPEMEHADAHSARVQPGRSAEIIWQFTQPGSFLYACLILGHWEAGMQGVVTVTGKAEASAAAISAHGMKNMPVTTKPMVMDDSYTSGQVRKVDVAQGKITIKHGVIKNLDMPGMTMIFRAKDTAMLNSIKAGDMVQFIVERQSGALVITDIKKAP